MRHCLLAACALTLFNVTGCQLRSLVETSERIDKAVEVTTLPAEGSAGRYEATVVAREADTYPTYMGVLMARASKSCSGRSFSVEQSSYGPEVDSPVPAGEKLRIVVSCNHDRLPNHRAVGPDDFTMMSVPPPEGSLSKGGSKLLDQHNGNERLAIEALIGGYVREAYTEECAGKSLQVEFIGSATSPGKPGLYLPDPRSAQATLHYRCVDAATDPAR